MSAIGFTKSLKKINFYKNINKNFKSLNTLENKIKKIITNKVGLLDNLVLRGNFNVVDSIISKLFEKKPKIFLVDDGLIDYMDPYWPIKSFSVYEIKFYIKSQISKIINTIINSICCLNFKNLFSYIIIKRELMPNTIII